ncbi:uncharacterized protein MELLADRAFT_60929 [Melampsora larici-populina 98AG31]|uniref:Uncharacterized protein n=1 Tax=Melampsora larici-populina (strain 98AG31 / pathotype 3-4-7) TaxID=747676 RepID=F4RCY9_MELLP|nr:uncharacterized protein MELLADRAFT_60929 [Melampsora larici-populina 98AG31]EGG09906.1 hypothetical protein MELLADRAFT_60929 [Melampsora larici-populina 98AG31]
MSSNITPFSGIPQRDAPSNSPSDQDTPMPMSYYIEILLSLSKAAKNTESKFNLPGRHIDPVLLPNQMPLSNTSSDPKETHKDPLAVGSYPEAQKSTELVKPSSAAMVRKPRQKMTLTECARKMERSYRGIARHASEISDTFRDLDTSRVHKRERTVTATDTVDQKSTKNPKRTKALPARVPRSRTTSSKPSMLPKIPVEPSRTVLKPRIRLCLANQIKYCNLVLNDQDSKENVPCGSLLSKSEGRKSDLVEKKSL